MKYISTILLLLILISYRPFGDIDGDYGLSITDLVIMRRITLGMESTPLQRLRADLNGDGIVDELDMNILRNYILHK